MISLRITILFFGSFIVIVTVLMLIVAYFNDEKESLRKRLEHTFENEGWYREKLLNLAENHKDIKTLKDVAEYGEKRKNELHGVAK